MATKKAKPVQAPPLPTWHDRYSIDKIEHIQSSLMIGPLELVVYTKNRSRDDGIFAKCFGANYTSKEARVSSLEEGKTKALELANEFVTEAQTILARLESRDWLENNPSAKE